MARPNAMANPMTRQESVRILLDILDRVNGALHRAPVSARSWELLAADLADAAGYAEEIAVAFKALDR